MTEELPGGAGVPMNIRVQLLHGYMQLVANAEKIDILHVKGASVHPSLQRVPRGSMDVDVLVRPADVERFIDALYARGWEKVTGFEEGSAFNHAMNMRHELGLVDIHRKWPGFEVSPEVAFTQLWAQAEWQEIAHVSCAVPGLPWQRLILLLHYGRSGGQRPDDLASAWTDATAQEREETRLLAQGFRSTLALAAATGGIDHFRDDPGYYLWRYFARGTGTRFEEWWGRWQAARGPVDKFRVARGFVTVNPDLLRLEIGHDPTLRDYGTAYRERLSTAVQEGASLGSRLLRRKGRP